MSHTITLIPGDGIGPEVTEAVLRIIAASGVSITWERQLAGVAAFERTGQALPAELLESIRRNRTALKGPVGTPIGEGFPSVNVGLRKALDLYANLRPVWNLPGVPARCEGVDLIIVRENTEDLYAGLEHEVVPGVVESLKIITERASTADRRVRVRPRAASRPQEGHGHPQGQHHEARRRPVSGQRARRRRRFPDLTYDEKIVDAACMHLVMNPGQFDVLVMPNLYGDIVSDLCAGLVGGLGVVGAANLGTEMGVFEAVHGSAPDAEKRGEPDRSAAVGGADARSHRRANGCRRRHDRAAPGPCGRAGTTPAISAGRRRPLNSRTRYAGQRSRRDDDHRRSTPGSRKASWDSAAGAEAGSAFGAKAAAVNVGGYRAIFRGAPMLDDIAQAVLAREEVVKYLRNGGERREDARDRIHGYLDELQTKQRYPIYRALQHPLYPILRKIERKHEHLHHVAGATGAHRIIYASNHKSHTDYLVEPLVLDDNGIRPPLIAAGINLFGGPLGLLHRHVTGAIPIRRNTKDPAYLVTLKAYVAEIIKKHDLLFYPEGGRSYSGELKPTRIGLIHAALTAERRDLVIIPTAIAYDLVLEDHILARQRVKKRQRPFTRELAEMVRYAVGYRSRAFVTFGAPMPVGDVDPHSRGDLLALTRQIRARIGALYKVLPPRCSPPRCGRQSRGAISESRIDQLIEELAVKRANLEVTSGREAVEKAAEPLETRGIVVLERGRFRGRDRSVLRTTRGRSSTALSRPVARISQSGCSTRPPRLFSPPRRQRSPENHRLALRDAAADELRAPVHRRRDGGRSDRRGARRREPRLPAHARLPRRGRHQPGGSRCRHRDSSRSSTRSNSPASNGTCR